jgi:hypothetical protein
MKQKRNAWNYEGIENYLREKNITYLFDNCLWKNRLKDAAKHAVIICSGHLRFVINKEPQDKTFSLRLLYVFFWVIPRRLNFICRRFGTLCLFHLVGDEWLNLRIVWVANGRRFDPKITCARRRLFSSQTFSRCARRSLFSSQNFSRWLPKLFSNLVNHHLPAYEDGTECSETSAYKIQTPGNCPKENIQLTEHGGSLKSRILWDC